MPETAFIYKDYDMANSVILGKGMQGTVLKVTSNVDKEEYAVKIIEKNQLTPETMCET